VRWPTNEWLSDGYVVWIAAAVMMAASACLVLLRGKRTDKYRRGTVVEDGVRAQRRAARISRAGFGVLTLAGVPIPASDETKHFKLIGTTGTGKSTAIGELLRAALARGDRAIFADPDGGYLEQFYQRFRGDIILNPFESGSVKWDWYAEINNAYDVEQLASGLIPSTDDASAREWRSYARTFFTAVARRCHQARWRDPAVLWRLLMIATSDELRPLVAGTPAQPFLEPDNARMFSSIRSVAGSSIAALEYIQIQRAAPFSVREWVRKRTSPSVLFIPYKAGQIAALRSMIANWMRLAIFEAMSQTDGGDQRLWFVVDELDALGAIDGLKDALARLRKFGGRCVLGFQSLAQVSDTYGAGEAQTIVENCGNTVILRCSGSDSGGTAHFASRLIGEREILRRNMARGSDREGVMGKGTRRSKSITENYLTELAVLPSQLEQLRDLTGYIKTASSRQWLRVSFARRPVGNRPY
jgi:type IV secretory pathway TraG/TraD family ATPase VirD4